MAITQLGAQKVAVGFASGTIAYMWRETENHDDSADIEYIKDEGADDVVALISNQGKRLSLEGTLLDGQEPPTKGDTVTLDGEAMLVESVSVRRTAKAARVSISVYKPDAANWGAGSN